MVSRLSSPFSLGYASHFSDDEAPPQADQLRVIDVTNSPTKRPSSVKSQDNSNGLSIQDNNSRHENNPRRWKENTSAQKRQADRDQGSYNARLPVRDRLGYPRTDTKRFKPNTFVKTERPKGNKSTTRDHNKLPSQSNN